MLSIGEFSQVTRLTIKTLRYYHELGILEPVKVDRMTGYRYFDENSLNRAGVIITLKEMGFSLQEIRTILEECDSEKDLVSHIRHKIGEIRSQVAALKHLEHRLSDFEHQITTQPSAGDFSGIKEISLDLPHAAVLPLKGRYDELGKAYRLLYRKLGRYATGMPYCFYYDLEYKEDDASMEAVIELSREIHKDGIEYRRIENLRGVKMMYRGTYGSQGNTYMKLYEYCHEKGYTTVPPLVEHFVKGPGMILQGNPQNYLTECIILISRNSGEKQ